MASQEDLFAPRDKTPWAKFNEKNVAVQGVVVEEPELSRVWNPNTNSPKLDKNGDPKPQLIVKVRQNDGTDVRIGFGEAKLYALRGALQDADASSVKVGGQVAIAWTDDFKTATGPYAAKVYTVKYVPPTA